MTGSKQSSAGQIPLAPSPKAGTMPPICRAANHEFAHNNPWCDVCERHFKSVQAYQQHMGDKHCWKHVCSFCSTVCDDSDDLDYHEEHYHFLEWDCPDCSRTCASENAIWQHIKAVHVPAQATPRCSNSQPPVGITPFSVAPSPLRGISGPNPQGCGITSSSPAGSGGQQQQCEGSNRHYRVVADGGGSTYSRVGGGRAGGTVVVDSSNHIVAGHLGGGQGSSLPNLSTSFGVRPKRGPVSVDCEFVGMCHTGCSLEDGLCSVAIVDESGSIIYSSLCDPGYEDIVDYRSWCHGIHPCEVQTAPFYKEVQRQVAEVLHGRIVIGVGVKKDLQALGLSHHPCHLIYDLAEETFLGQHYTIRPGLQRMAKDFLQRDIQITKHSAAEDAVAAMDLWKYWLRATGT